MYSFVVSDNCFLLQKIKASKHIYIEKRKAKTDREKKVCIFSGYNTMKITNIFPFFFCKFLDGKNFLNSIAFDLSDLDVKQEDVIDKKFLFSSKTTERSEIEMEIQEIENNEYQYSVWKNAQIGMVLGGSAIGISFVYKGLGVWENWMKDQEKKDIEEEIQMTGTYVNPETGNIETSIDPITGKKIQIKFTKEKPA